MVELNGPAKRTRGCSKSDRAEPADRPPRTAPEKDGHRDRKRAPCATAADAPSQSQRTADQRKSVALFGMSRRGRGHTNCVGGNYWGARIRRGKNLAPWGKPGACQVIAHNPKTSSLGFYQLILALRRCRSRFTARLAPGDELRNGLGETGLDSAAWSCFQAVPLESRP